MKFGRIIGNVVATAKDRNFVGKKLLLIQPVDGAGRALGTPIVGMDAVGAGAGELILYVGGKEASFPFLPEEVPVDAGIVAIIDSIDRVASGPEKDANRREQQASEVQISGGGAGGAIQPAVVAQARSTARLRRDRR